MAMPRSLSEDGCDFFAGQLFFRIEGGTSEIRARVPIVESCSSLSLMDAAVWSRSGWLSAARAAAPKTWTHRRTRGAPWPVAPRALRGWRSAARAPAALRRAAAVPRWAGIEPKEAHRAHVAEVQGSVVRALEFRACLHMQGSRRCCRPRLSRTATRLIYGLVTATRRRASTWRTCVASGSATAATFEGTAARTRATTRATAPRHRRSSRRAQSASTSRRRSTACWCASRTESSETVRRE